MDDADRFDDFEAQVAALERSMQGARDVAAAFDDDLASMRTTLADASVQVKGLDRSLSRGLRRAFEDLVFDGAKLSDVMTSLADSVGRSVYSAAVKPVFNHFGGVLSNGIESLISGILPFADGAPFSQGRVVPFASGGIVSGPVHFPMRGGTGLMGEAGPEAILPLSRTADGRLGVEARGAGRPVTVVVNVTTPDVAGFERSQSQIAAQMARALGRASRNR